MAKDKRDFYMHLKCLASVLFEAESPLELEPPCNRCNEHYREAYRAGQPMRDLMGARMPRFRDIC